MENITPQERFKGRQEYNRQLQYAGILDECCYNKAPTLAVDMCRIKACRIAGLPECRVKLTVQDWPFTDRRGYIRLCLNMQKPKSIDSNES